MKKTLTIFIGLAVAALSAADARRVRLEDFSHPAGGVTLGGEFPGAKAELSFEGADSDRFARLSFDLSKGNYVGYELNTTVPAGTSGLAFRVRTPGAARPRLFCRVLDADGQYHAYRTVFEPRDGWTEVGYDFAAGHGHWGGKNDGVLRWPLKTVTLGIEIDRSLSPTGALEVADVVARTTASRMEMPAAKIRCVPSRFGALYGPAEHAAFDCSLFVAIVR